MHKVRRSDEEISSFLKKARRMAGRYGNIGCVEPDDIAQIAVMKVLKRTPGELPSEAYLARVVQNAAYDAMRSRKREPERYYELDPDHAMESVCERVDESGSFNLSATHVAPSDEYDPDLWDHLQTALGQLSSPLAKVLVLVAAGHSYEEISTITNTNIGTVRSRLHHARRRAQELLGDIA